MPSRLNSPIIAVDMNRVAGVDPSNVDNLFSMWTIFSKCAESLENGRRLENLSWRLWNRETFCCDDDDNNKNEPTPTPKSIRKPTRQQSDSFVDMPELSSSVESAPSEDELPKQRADSEASRPCLIRSDSTDRYRGREKHMTPVNLARIMEDIDRSKSSTVEWISERSSRQQQQQQQQQQQIPKPTTPKDCPKPAATTATEPEEGAEPRSTHSVVRGFSPSRISSSYRSSASLAAAQKKAGSESPKKVEVSPSAQQQQQKKKPFFIIGSSSSDEDFEDSYNEYKSRGSSRLSEGLRRTSSGADKKTAFRDEVATRTVYDEEDSSDDDDAVSESAIEDDDLDWESSTESMHSSYEDGPLFKRVESRPELTSRRSLLSTLLHEPERAAALANAASRSSPAIRRTDSPRELQFAQPIKEENEFPGSKPIKRVNSMHPLALSPRTTRRNMLATELTESLRKQMLWERQQKNTTASAHLKRRHTAHDVTKLTEYPQPRGKVYNSNHNSWNSCFDQGQYEYHAAGW